MHSNEFQRFKESRSRRVFCVLEGLGNLPTSTKPPISAEAEMGGFCSLYVQMHCLPLLNSLYNRPARNHHFRYRFNLLH